MFLIPGKDESESDVGCEECFYVAPYGFDSSLERWFNLSKPSYYPLLSRENIDSYFVWGLNKHINASFILDVLVLKLLTTILACSLHVAQERTTVFRLFISALRVFVSIVSVHSVSKVRCGRWVFASSLHNPHLQWIAIPWKWRGILTVSVLSLPDLVSEKRIVFMILYYRKKA